MHASNLLKAVLKPRSITSSSSGQSLNQKDSQSRGNRPSSPETSSASLSVSKKSSSTPVPVKMSCLCAPTNHAGSFRCRLHRGTQQSWGGRPLAPAATPATKPTPAAAENGPSSVTPVATENGNTKRIAQKLPTPRQAPMSFAPRQPPHMNYAPVHRTSDARPSRLSRVSVANEVETPVAQAHVAAAPKSKDGSGTVRYMKFTGGAGCASGAVLEGGMVFIKKIHTGKDVMRDVFGSGSGLSRAGLSL